MQTGKIEPCLVPVASLMNHSSNAHIIDFGRLDADAQCLSFRLARPCASKEECFLSYGRLPNLSLLLYYGFALKNNPNDTIPLTLEVTTCCKRCCLHGLSTSQEHDFPSRVVLVHADKLHGSTCVGLHCLTADGGKCKVLSSITVVDQHCM